jgi:AcrR family transcriptional regulator
MRIQFSDPAPSRSALAVRRGLGDRQATAAEEVERLLAAAVTVMDRVTPAAPKVSEIVAESGLSNKAFYRYFGGKDDVILAVLERGVGLVESYLQHRMAKADTPVHQTEEWVRGVMAQAAAPDVASQSRAVICQLSVVAGGRAMERELTEPLRRILQMSLHQAESLDPERDGDVIFEATFGTMRRHVLSGTGPGPEEVDHLVAFCLGGMSLPAGQSPPSG